MKAERKINDERLLELAESGMSQTDIAAEFGCSQYAVSKRLKRLTPAPPSALDNLTPPQAAFVQRVASGMSPTHAAFESYDCTSRDSAKQIGKKLMQFDEIRGGVEEIMNGIGLTRGYRIKKLKTHVDNVDPGLSLRALELAMKAGNDMAPIEINVTQDFEIRALIAHIVPSTLPESSQLD